MTSPLVRGMRRVRPHIGWLAGGLMLILVWIAATGIMEADWVRGDILFFYVGTWSLLVTAILSATRLAGPWAALISAGVGIVSVGQAVARLLPPLVGGARELWEIVVWLWLQLRQADPSLPELPMWRESGARLAVLGQRLASWAAGLLNGQPGQNLVAFLFVSGLILWACTAWVVWWIVRRGRPLLAVLPLGVLLSISTYFSTGPVSWVVGYVGCVTALLPVVHFRLQELRWEREGIDYSPEIRLDVVQIAFLFVTAVVILSLITPSFSIPRLVWSFWELIRHPQAVLQDMLVRFFGGVEPETPPEIPVPARENGGRGAVEASLPRSHLLGGNPDLTRQRVMNVCTDAPPPPLPDEYMPQEIPVGPKFYWRGITYDFFTGRYWGNRQSLREEMTPYEPVLSTPISPALSLRQRYLIEVPHGETLYAVGEPYEVDQQVYRRLRAPDDLVGLEGTTSDYVVHSQVSQATARLLRESPKDYPERIVDLYLELSEDTPGRVRALATQITRDAGAAYDKVIAIEHYLRQFPYDLEVPVPPPGRDVVEFFLFDVQRGYCDYYASAFVVLSRAAGVPARLAVGYAMGAYDTARGCYEVTERDGHSWPEVYFTGVGWVPFEPTAPFQLFQRPQDETLPAGTVPGVPSMPSRPWSISVRNWWNGISDQWTTYVALAAVAAFVVLTIAQMYGQWRHSRLTSVQAIALVHRDMLRMGERLGVTRRPHQTPQEYGAILAATLSNRVPRWPWRGKTLRSIVPEARTHVRALSGVYEHASYGAHSLVKAHQIHAEREWQHLRRQMRWLWWASSQLE